MQIKQINSSRKKIFEIVAGKFTSSAISIYSGQTAFFIILSFFPFMLFFFSILNLTPLSEADVIAWGMTLIPDSFHDILSAFTEDIYNSSTGRVSITIIVALWLSSKAMVAMQYGLDSMYGIQETRNVIWMRILSILYSIALAVVLILLLGLMVFGKTIVNHLFPHVFALRQLVAFRYILIIPILILFFCVIFTVLPNEKHHFLHQLPGAIFSSIGWIIFSWIFSIYVNGYCNYASIYGTMTTIILIMVWLYGCIYVIFLGGLLNSMLALRKREPEATLKQERNEETS